MAKLPKHTAKKVTNLILLALEKSVDGYIRFQDFIYKPGYYAYGSGWDYPLNKASLSKALKRLREGGYIDFIEEDEVVLKLTDKGKQKAVIAQLQSPEEDWDGKWRVVIFDVPESRRNARDLLRHNLKVWGFTQWQQSVWVTKKSCTEALRKYIVSIGIEDWVMVLESDNVGR